MCNTIIVKTKTSEFQFANINAKLKSVTTKNVNINLPTNDETKFAKHKLAKETFVNLI